MTLKVITALHILFNVAFHLGNKFWEENMYILANMRPKICIKGLLFSAQRLSLFWVWQGGSERMMNKSDMGEGGKKCLYFEWHTFWISPYVAIINLRNVRWILLQDLVHIFFSDFIRGKSYTMWMIFLKMCLQGRK